MTEITCVMLDITTVCNLACPNCCVKPKGLQAHYPWEYFEEVAPFIYGIDRVDLTGGEPTCHPQFSNFVPKFKALFGCKLLGLETNCFKAREHAGALSHFDIIRIGSYERNSAEVNWVLDHYFTAFQQNIGLCGVPGEPLDRNNHVSVLRRGSGKPCNVQSRQHVAYSGGMFYPCRLGPGIDGAIGIKPCADWREKVQELPIPCGNCLFSPNGEVK